MQLEQLKTPSGAVMQGPLLITPQAFGDARGWFYESWNQRKFDEAVGESVMFSQDNHSCLLYTSPSPRDVEESRMPSSA